jgi:hypothetical protein
MNRRLLPAIFAVALVLPGSLGTKADPPALPGNGFDASRYKTLWTKSPFAVASDNSAQTSPDYSLVGIAEIDGISYASLIDKQSQEHFLLCSDKPDRGLTLISIKRGQDTSDTTAIIQKKDGESINTSAPFNQQGIIRRGPPPAPFRPRIIIPPPRPFRPNGYPQQQQQQQQQ